MRSEAEVGPFVSEGAVVAERKEWEQSLAQKEAEPDFGENSSAVVRAVVRMQAEVYLTKLG